MKIAMINPRNRLVYSQPGDPSYSSNKEMENFYRTSSSIQMMKSFTFTPNPALLQLAAMVDNEDEIFLIDENLEDIDYQQDYDLVAITAMTQQAERAYEIAVEFRERKIHTVIGGVHASLLPDEALQYVDTVVVGEGELLWPVFLKDFRSKKPKRFYTPHQKRQFDIAQCPVPSYDKVNMNAYKIFPIQISRGCPRDCEFCVVSKISGRNIRHNRIDAIIAEIAIIKNKIGKRRVNIFFCDDNIFVDRQFITELLREISSLKIKWASQCDVSIVKSPNLIELAADSGCFQLLIGFESINTNSLNSIDLWKSKQIKNYANVISAVQKCGIAIWGSFIFGNDGDDKEIFKRTLDFIIKHNLSSALFNILTPLPGSELYRRLSDENRLFEKRFWNRCTFYDVLFEPKKMTSTELMEGFNWLMFEYYKPENQRRIRNHFKELIKTNVQRRMERKMESAV